MRRLRERLDTLFQRLSRLSFEGRQAPENKTKRRDR